jgi:8-oxo-dGTP pyrophosphatase MutT (NUDIX family)
VTVNDGLGELADAIGRPRMAADAADASVPVAGTVIVVRSGDGGPEVLMMERPDRGSFAGAWVFPGGKVEDGDAGATEEDVARSAGVRETREETGVVLDAGAVVTLSRWDPPVGVPKRIRTWFFVAPAPVDETLLLSDEEAVSAAWVRPADMLARHGRGELTLYPPTWVTLLGLADAPDAAALLRAAAEPALFDSAARSDDRGPYLLWAGDEEYAAGQDAPATGSRHRLRIDSLPWVYERHPAP